MERRTEITGVAAAVAAAAAMRFYHLGHGLPELVHVDAFKFVGEALRLGGAGELTPHMVQYPGLFTHLLALLYALGGLEGIGSTHLAARALCAVAGCGLVAATWLLGRRLAGARVGLAAAFLAALCPVALSSSRTSAPDILLGLFVVLALWAGSALPPGRRRALTAGAFTGVALGTKFTALLLLPATAALAVAGVAGWRERSRSGVLWALACAGVFSLTTPFFWAELPRYLERLAREAQLQRWGQIGRVQGGWLDYLVSATPTWEQPWLATSLVGNLGWPFVLAVLGGAVLAAIHRQRGLVFIAVGAAAYMLFITGPGRIKAVRFLLPILPLLQILAAAALDQLATRLPRPHVQPVLLAGLLVAVAAPALLNDVDALSLTTRETSNRQAELWMRREVAPGTPTLLSPFFVANLRETGIAAYSLPNVGARQYARPPELGPSPERDPIYSAAVVDQAADTGIELIVLNSYFDGAFAPVPENLRFFPRSVAGWRAFRERLAERARLVAVFPGYRDGRLGPDIEVWRIARGAAEDP